MHAMWRLFWRFTDVNDCWNKFLVPANALLHLSDRVLEVGVHTCTVRGYVIECDRRTCSIHALIHSHVVTAIDHRPFRCGDLSAVVCLVFWLPLHGCLAMTSHCNKHMRWCVECSEDLPPRVEKLKIITET